MPDIYITDPLGNTIRLTDERIDHIYNEHPSLYGRVDLVIETVVNPDMVRSHPDSSMTHNYFKEFDEDNSRIRVRVAVISGEGDMWIVTEHHMSRRRLMQSGVLIWKTQQS